MKQLFDATDYEGEAHPIDRRRLVRNRSYLGGQVVATASSFSAPCIVRNTSLDGARIETAHPELMPADPLLVINQQGMVYETATVWLSLKAVGLRLLAAFPLHGAVSARHARARELWVDSLPRSSHQPDG